MSKIVVTGSASGIGAALVGRLAAAGCEVVGVDVRQAEIVADLATADGRRAAVEAVMKRCDGRLEGVVACAGLGPQVRPLGVIAAVNYFGAVEILEGLRPALAAAGSAAAVAVSSNSIGFVPGADGPISAACLAGDESSARSLAEDSPGPVVYAASKLALTRWLRRRAVTADWAGAGIRLNAVAFGAVQTPLLQGGLDNPELGAAIRSLPVPLGIGAPAEAAIVIEAMLGGLASFMCGSVVYADGGTDALFRPDVP